MSLPDALPSLVQSLSLSLAGAFAGFIDAIAGGGGLINLPVLTLVLGPGVGAIGTNKVAGTAGALVALLVYAKKGHMNFRKSLAFTLWIGVGAFLGSLISPYLPVDTFRWILMTSCPVILWIIWRKDLWVEQELKVHERKYLRHFPGCGEMNLFLPGVVCGIYDGVWGPGGGTFMFLALLFFARMPLMSAIAASKMANTCSAGVALMSYGSRGYVHWPEGLWMALGIGCGAYLGASYATKNAARIVRPILLIVVSLLIIRLLQ